MAPPVLQSAAAPSKLDAREEQFRVPSPHRGLSLFLRYLAPSRATEPLRRAVLYVLAERFHRACRSRTALTADPGAMRCVLRGSMSGVSISTALASRIRIRR